MYSYQNAEGEPMMSGVDYMREGAYADEANYEYALDTEYGVDRHDAGGWEPDPNAPEDCEHGNGSFPEGAGFNCDDCDTTFIGPRTMPGVDDYWQTGDFWTYGN